MMNYTDDCTTENDVPESQERAHGSRNFTPIYPTLNAATAGILFLFYFILEFLKTMMSPTLHHSHTYYIINI